jgi:signal transduction histidine kinase
MKKLITMFLLLLLVNYSFAQKQGMELIDSLKSKLTNSIEDTSKVRLLGKLSFQYYGFDTDLGIFYAEQAIKLAEKLQWKKGIAFSYNYLGTNYAVKGNYPKAAEYFSKSLSRYTEIGDKQGIAFLSNNLGNFYRIQKDYPKAIGFINKAITINKQLNNKIDLTKNYNNLGSVYSATSDFVKSNESYSMALQIAKDVNNKALVALILTNISENREKQKDYCGAIELALQAVQISEKLNITYDRALYYSFIGGIYLKISDDTVIKTSRCQYYSNDRKENLFRANGYLLKSIKLLNKINDLSLLSDNSLLLSRVYEKLGDTKNALLWYKKYSENKDSVFSKDNSIAISNIEKKREVELRDKQIIIQSLEIDKKNSQIISQIILIAFILLLTALVPYLYYKRIKKQKKHELILQLSLEKEKELNEIKSRFVATTSHEFRTPLMAILTSAGLVQRYADSWDADKQNEHLDKIKKSVVNLTKLLDDVLTISKNDSGKIIFSPKQIDLLKCVEECQQEAKSLMTNTHELKLNYRSDQKEFLIDPTLIKFVFNNLLSNAIKYSPNGGKIELAISTDEENIIIEISDEGIGIPVGETQKIFDSFYRSKNATEISGTGLGLAIVKSAVDLHKGKITARNNLNKGVTFVVKIPIKITL